MAEEQSGWADAYDFGRGALDVLGVGEAIAVGAGGGLGPGFTPGMERVMGPLGWVTTGIDAVTGASHIYDGYQKSSAGEDGSIEYLDGAHDLIGAGAGALGNVPGPVGACAKAFGAGYAVGDMIAPHVFGSEEEDNKPHMEQVPENGVFKPSTGNQYVDGALDIFGIRD